MREFLTDFRRRIWNKGIKLFWYRLWIRRDEFHKSLDTDLEAMFVMDQYELRDYYADLAARRKIAHKRDLKRKKR